MLLVDTSFLVVTHHPKGAGAPGVRVEGDALIWTGREIELTLDLSRRPFTIIKRIHHQWLRRRRLIASPQPSRN
jgi:hypothetical protein